TLRIFDSAEDSPSRGATVYRLPVRDPHQSPLADVEFSPTNGQHLATIDNQGLMELWTWDPAHPRPLSPLYDAVAAGSSKPDWGEDLRFGNDVAWSTDGTFLTVLQDGVIGQFRLRDEQLARIDYPVPEG